MTLTDEEIIKALEFCIDTKSCRCSDCQFDKVVGCQEYLMNYTLDIINRQKEQNEQLKHELKMMLETAKSYKSEIEELNEEIRLSDDLLGCQQARIDDLENSLAISKKEFKRYVRPKREVVNEAIKEFAERFREKADRTLKGQFDFNDEGCITNENISTEYIISKDEFDEILKEMVGDAE